MADKSERVTVKRIVEEYLQANGYDGLFHTEGDGCACLVAGEFMSCEENEYQYSNIVNCRPGYKVRCNCLDHFGWHMTMAKPRAGGEA